jgi:hypothetical protein
MIDMTKKCPCCNHDNRMHVPYCIYAVHGRPDGDCGCSKEPLK